MKQSQQHRAYVLVDDSRLFVWHAGGVAGPKVAVIYSGLIEAPKNVHCAEITGHSAVVVWDTGFLSFAVTVPYTQFAVA